MDKVKILVVEDNRIVAEDIKNNLEQMGYNVSAIATSGEKALAAADKETPDIALMDIRLGEGMNGIDAATELRRRHQTPIIYLTAHADHETIGKAKVTEPYAYLVKPFDNEELQSAVEIAVYKHKMARELAENRKWLLTTLKSIGDGVIATDRLGRVKFMNPVAEEMTGWPQAEAKGRLLGEVFQLISEQTREPCEDPAAKVIASGQIIGLANHTLLISRDGREIPIKDSGAPIILQGSDPIGVVLVFQNDTESRAAANRLRTSEEKLRLAMESADEGVWEYDLASQAMRLDEYCFAMLGHAPSNNGDHRLWWLDQIHPEDRKSTELALDEVLQGVKEQVDIDYRLARKDASYIWVSSRAALVRRVGEKNPSLVVGVQRNINERKKAEQEKLMLETQLHHAQKMEAIGTLAGGIAHDFNNILASVIGYTELSLDEVDPGQMLHQHLKEILVAGMRARDLVKQILMFSRHTEYDLKPVRLNHLVRETARLMRATIPTSIHIEEKISEESLTVTANPSQLHQIIVNLCTNAFHAMQDDGGTMTIELDSVALDHKMNILYTNIDPGRYARVTIKDTGIGIEKNNFERIFDPYFTTKAQDKGTGLGLSIVQGIVKSHKGYITVDSEPRRGSSFSVYLPTALIDYCIPETLGQDDLPTGNERVLLVDDEPAIVHMQRKILQRLGYVVEVMTCSKDALTLYKNDPHRFDLVITDMTMPKLSGVQLTRAIKELRRELPVIICTGYSEKINPQILLEINADGFLMKPVDKANLAQCVRKILDDE